MDGSLAVLIQKKIPQKREALCLSFFFSKLQSFARLTPYREDLMSKLPDLLANNKQWADKIRKEDPEFFTRLAKQQTPKYLWVGCSDSRVPANQIIGLDPGEVFVHRNVGNQVVHTDMNCQSVIQFSVDILKVEEIIVCGHYNCGAILNAIDGKSLGLVDNWIRPIKDTFKRNFESLKLITDPKEHANKLVELNVKQQALNVCHSTTVQAAWERGQKLRVHSWVYGLEDGEIKDLDFSIESKEQVEELFHISL